MVELSGIITVIIYCIIWISFPSAALADERRPEAHSISPAEIQRQGERMYRLGILPSGKPLEAIVMGDIKVDSNIFSCVSCHLRGGLGSNEGGVVTPPTNGSKLFQPLYYGRELTPAERSRLAKHYQTPPLRPAYTDSTLAVIIRDGIDPTGKEMKAIMPRYLLDDRDMGILISYLKSLSAEQSPGVTDKTIRFATVITEEVALEDRTAMLATLDNFVADWNSQAKIREARVKYPEIAQEADLSYRRLSLARWELKGPPAIWRSQLEEYLRKEPVFALIGGITTGEWKPVHEFSEEHKIPSVFPLTDFPVNSGFDWYTLYFSKGLYQEGETAARALRRTADIADDDTVLQLSRDTREGHALSAGFQETWQEFGRKPPVNQVIPADGPIQKEFIRQLTENYKPAVILLWTGSEALPALEAIASDSTRPRAVYLSASLFQQTVLTLPEQVRSFTRITYPYRLPLDEKMHASNANAWLQKRNIPVNDRRISTRMYSLMLLMTETMKKMRRNFYRDHFLDIISMSAGHNFPDYERLSFGPGQRYAAKGCYVVELSRGPKPTFIRISDWVIH